MNEAFKFGLGSLPNPPDERDFLLANYLAPQPIPPMVSYKDLMTPVKNQGKLGSCVAFGTSAVKEFFDMREFGILIDLSEQWLYGECKKTDGLNEEGTFPRAAMEVLLKQGVPEEKFQPYEGVYPPRNNALSGYIDNADIYKIQAYATITGGLQGLKEALALNGPVGIAISVYSSFYETTGDGMVPAPKGPQEGGHMMCAVGYDDTKQILIIKNSWGVNWGDKGYGYIPYTVWSEIGVEAMSLVDKSNLKTLDNLPDCAIIG